MKKSFLTLLIIILFVGFLESFPKHYIIETIAGTTKATDKVGKHHGCVDSSGRKYMEYEMLERKDKERFDNRIFVKACECFERKPSSISEKQCRWQVESFGWFGNGNTTNNKAMVIDNEEECKGQCHIPEDYEDVDYAEWLNAECLEECSDFVNEGLISK